MEYEYFNDEDACDDCGEALAQVMEQEWVVTQHSVSVRTRDRIGEVDWQWKSCNDGDGDCVETKQWCFKCYAEKFGHDLLSQHVKSFWEDQPMGEPYDESEAARWAARQERQREREDQYHLRYVDVFENVAAGTPPVEGDL